MKGENLIHIRFAHDEALQSKKGMLSTELGLLKIARIIKKYRALRLEELRTKLKLHRKLRELTTSIRKLETTLPKLKIPEILKEHEEKAKTYLKIEKDEHDAEIEKQLQDIQNQLQSLGR